MDSALVEALESGVNEFLESYIGVKQQYTSTCAMAENQPGIFEIKH